MIRAYCDFCGKEIDYHKVRLGTGLTYPPPYTFYADVDYCGSAFSDLCEDCKREFDKFIMTERSKYNKVVSDYIDSHKKAHNE
jgi:hypothetical protein